MREIILAICCLAVCIGSAFAQVAVIAHPSVPLDRLEKTELRYIYTGDIRKWGNGEAVVVFDLKPNGEMKDAFYDFLGKSPSRMKSIWLKNLLSGEGDPPESLKSEQEMLAKVAATRGAIGFISESMVDKSVKVLLLIREKGT